MRNQKNHNFNRDLSIPERINGKRNPKYYNLHNKQYFENHREQNRIKSTEYYKTHKKQCKDRMRKYGETHKEQHKKYNKNWYQNHKEEAKEKSKRWRENHKEYHKKYNKNYWIIKRNTILRSTKINNGKSIVCNKRLYPLDNACELCGKTNKILVYHHWNNEHLEFGIWVCNSSMCHWLAETIDNPKFEKLKNKYLNLKQIIEKTPILKT
jgi:hypothetical protein